MTLLLSKKQSISSSQKQEEETVRFAHMLSEKGAEMLKAYNENRRKIMAAMAEMKAEHDSFKKSIIQEKASLNNEVETIRSERKELLKPVDEIIATWKQRLKDAETTNALADRRISDLDDARDRLITHADGLRDKELKLESRGKKMDILTLSLQGQVLDLERREQDVTVREEKAHEREMKIISREEAVTSRALMLQRDSQRKTERLNKRDKDLRTREIQLADRIQRHTNHGLRPE